MAADACHVVSDVPVRGVTGHVDPILRHTLGGGIRRILLAGIVELVLEAHGQNVHQLRQRMRKHIGIIMQSKKVCDILNQRPGFSRTHTC